MKLNEQIFINYNFTILDSRYVYYSEDGITSIIITPSADGFFYPSICQMPEMAGMDEQIVFLKRIEFLEQLQKLFEVIFAENVIDEKK
jgi:hypothetical protein